MANMKTAISIEKSIFEQMDALAKKAKISRSRLFAIAAREFIQRNNNMDLLQSLNSAYKDLTEIDPIVTKMRSTHYDLVKDQW
jgi:antitoxin MazE6